MQWSRLENTTDQMCNIMCYSVVYQYFSDRGLENTVQTIIGLKCIAQLYINISVIEDWKMQYKCNRFKMDSSVVY
jgi:hypothetical protein